MIERSGATTRKARLAELEVVLDSLPVPAALALDPTAQHIRINPAFSRLVGVAAEPAVQRWGYLQ